MKRFANRRCVYCRDKTQPDFKEVQRLQSFLSRFMKIEPRGKTGLCARHQRELATEIKRARHLALLPFTVR